MDLKRKFNTLKKLRTKNNIRVIFLLFFVSFGCFSNPEKHNKICTIIPSQSDLGLGIEKFSCLENKLNKKSIFIFMDGTNNNKLIPTNIYRLKNLIYESNDGQTIGFYINGVGNKDHGTLGTINSRGLEKRILKAYEFLMENYKPDDEIYIFGFSRGGLSARALGGLISYAGIPAIEKNEESFLDIANEIIEITKDIWDEDYEPQWEKWKRDKPLLADLIKKEENIEVQYAEIAFMGIWDTVPGSFATANEYFRYSDVPCKETLDWNKKWIVIREVFWLFSGGGMAKGERYKIGSYPAIQHIAQAMSHDEKRTMFRPLFICDPIINKNQTTKVTQSIFPGAHADVGGGYEDFNNQLPEVSLNWMIDMLKDHYSHAAKYKPFENANPLGLAHLSISDKKASTKSNCEDRSFPPNTGNIQFHDSLKMRKITGSVPLFIGRTPELPECNSDDSDYEEWGCSTAKEKNGYKPIKVEQKDINCEYIINQKWTSKD